MKDISTLLSDIDKHCKVDYQSHLTLMIYGIIEITPVWKIGFTYIKENHIIFELPLEKESVILPLNAVHGSHICIERKPDKIIGSFEYRNKSTHTSICKIEYNEFFDNIKDEGYRFNLSLLFGTQFLEELLKMDKFITILNLIKEFIDD